MSKMYVVYQLGKPATSALWKDKAIPHEDDCWANNKFDSLMEAIQYTKDWLGMYYNGEEIVLGEKFYFAEDSYMLIKEESC